MPDTFDFAVSGINHAHIYGPVDAMLAAGCRLTAFHAPEGDLGAQFAKAYPQARRVADERAIMEGARIRLVVGARVPADRAGVALRATAPAPDPLLVRAIVEARRRLAAYLDPAGALTISDIARREGGDVGDVSRSLQLAFLAPDLVEDILNGTQPVELTCERLKRADLPLLWKDQRAALA